MTRDQRRLPVRCGGDPTPAEEIAPPRCAASLPLGTRWLRGSGRQRLAIAYIHCRSNEADALAAKDLTDDEARRVVTNTAKLKAVLTRTDDFKKADASMNTKDFLSYFLFFPETFGTAPDGKRLLVSRYFGRYILPDADTERRIVWKLVWRQFLHLGMLAAVVGALRVNNADVVVFLFAAVAVEVVFLFVTRTVIIGDLDPMPE